MDPEEIQYLHDFISKDKIVKMKHVRILVNKLILIYQSNLNLIQIQENQIQELKSKIEPKTAISREQSKPDLQAITDAVDTLNRVDMLGESISLALKLMMTKGKAKITIEEQ